MDKTIADNERKIEELDEEMTFVDTTRGSHSAGGRAWPSTVVTGSTVAG